MYINSVSNCTSNPNYLKNINGINKINFKGYGDDKDNNSLIPRDILKSIYTANYHINPNSPTQLSDTLNIGGRLVRRNINVDVFDKRDEIVIEENYIFDDDNNF